MASIPKEKDRNQQAKVGEKGLPTFSWQTTETSIFDTVKLIMPPNQVLPIIFVPGIMGSNLMGDDGKPVWLLNSTGGQPAGLALMWANKGAGSRQKALHPARTKVFSGGAVPKKPVGTIQDKAEFSARGWGEVGETSYHKFLLWLEKKLNSEGFDPNKWDDFFYTSISATPEPGKSVKKSKLFPGIAMEMSGLPPIAEEGHMTTPIMSDDLLKRAKCRFPVYACGYNWLASNKAASGILKIKIDKIIAENNRREFKCSQVILVTHSMGGLVARACSKLPEMEGKIAGIVHGVMPTVGAAVAYRRCKVGMMDEDVAAGLVIGSTGKAVTSVFAQAPGALQLLPSQEYGSRWLNIKDATGKNIESLPVNDPYTEIYLRKDRWWGLVKEEWLKPEGGEIISWDQFVVNIMLAKDFHKKLSGKYHPNTFVYYGAGDGKQASFETIRWSIRRGLEPDKGARPNSAQVMNFSHQQVRDGGSNKIYVGGDTKIDTMGMHDYFGVPSTIIYDTSFWEISCEMQDGRGDGTVPASSGMAPRMNGGKNIRQQFRLQGFSHEPSYQNPTAQRVTHYAITKIVSEAKIS
jgi:hypothetical protein